ncbi:hypothetical protein [Archangium lansingense]|uniref:Uncharacterized protein n=1 Tax=Archangium lansingense TaxID=2995310 RepID=A0ABT4ANW8_9BACT|nr:hypothetical protein [Archangium lansinium]MCY1082849.1 hypothetical protein [Archangium lansinium]
MLGSSDSAPLSAHQKEPADRVAAGAAPGARSFWARFSIPAGLLLVLLCHHLAIWLYLSARKGIPLVDMLNQWDSAHYSTIATSGHGGGLWAFLPLYPALVRSTLALCPSGVPPQVAGAILSTVALLLFIALVVWAQGWRGRTELLVPRNHWGWFLLLYAPASYTLHTEHTESVFLLLSAAALLAAANGRAWSAGLLAALCVWTRNQGVFVALASALLVMEMAESTADRAKRFLLVGSLSFCGFLGLLGFQAAMTGDPLASMHAQSGWSHATSVWSAVRTLWFGNPWQNTGFGSLLRHGFFFVLLFLALAIWRVRRPLGLYALLSLLVMLLQGEFVNAFRFGGVLFPLAFFAGDRLERLPRWTRGLVVVVLVALNQMVTRRYALGSWAY